MKKILYSYTRQRLLIKNFTDINNRYDIVIYFNALVNPN